MENNRKRLIEELFGSDDEGEDDLVSAISEVWYPPFSPHSFLLLLLFSLLLESLF